MESSDLVARNKLLKARVLATRQVASCYGTGPCSALTHGLPSDVY